MKSLKTPFAAAIWLSCLQLASADTIILKNGDEIEGKVLREQDGNYVVEIMVTATIRDEKIIPKSDVKLINKEKKDSKAFKEIEDLIPTPELLPKAQYEARIEKVEAFIKGFPKSISISKAKKIHDQLTEEYKIIQNGGFKFGDKMVSADEYMANAYEYDARIEENAIKEAVGRRDFLSALRAFSKYDNTFSTATGRDELVSLMKQVLTAYGATIDQNLASLESRLEKRASGLAGMAAEDRGATRRALAEQEARTNARYEEEKTAKESWITPDAFHKASLTDASRQVKSEMRRLDSKKPKMMDVPVAESYRVAWGKLSEGTDDEKKDVISEAKNNGVPDLYLEKLSERADIEDP